MIQKCLIALKRPERPLFLTPVMSFSYLISLLFPMYVSMCVCLSVCLFPRGEVISQSIFKYDISTNAYSQQKGVSENRFKIKPDVEKLFRKNLITHGRHHVLAQKCTRWFGIGFLSGYTPIRLVQCWNNVNLTDSSSNLSPCNFR